MVILAIVAHRFLRLDLTNELVASLHPQALLTGLLALTLGAGVLTRSVSLRPSGVLLVQWGLWGWALISKVVADGPSWLGEFVKGDYAKDMLFATLVSITATTLSRLRMLSWVVVATLALIAAITIPQHSGPKQCYHYKLTGELNYNEQTDGRPCVGAADCFDVPKGEEHLREEGWACERTGSWGLATVLERIHYVGNLVDPNALAQALVMATALGLGLLTWPRSQRSSALQRLFLLAAVVLMSVAVVYAASRAAQLALALVFLCFFYVRFGLLGIILAALGGAPVVLISNRNAAEAAYSTLTRIMTYMNGYDALWQNPVFGVGFANYEKISFINAHNSFFQAITETGLIGGSLYLLGIYLCFKLVIGVALWPQPDADPARLELRHLARTLLAMLVGVVSCVFFLSLAFDVMWLFPVGIIAAFHAAVRQQLPDYELRVRGWELLLVLACGALLPAAFLFFATRNY